MKAKKRKKHHAASPKKKNVLHKRVPFFFALSVIAFMVWGMGLWLKSVYIAAHLVY